MDAFLVPRPTDSDAVAASDGTEPIDSDATEHAAEREKDGDATNCDEDGDATEHARGGASAVITAPPTKKQRSRSSVVSKQQPGHATERAACSEDSCDKALPPFITSLVALAIAVYLH